MFSLLELHSIEVGSSILPQLSTYKMSQFGSLQLVSILLQFFLQGLPNMSLLLQNCTKCLCSQTWHFSKWMIWKCNQTEPLDKWALIWEFHLLGKNISPPSSGSKSKPSKKPTWSMRKQSLLHTGFLFRIFFGPEDGGDMFLRKVNWLSTDYQEIEPFVKAAVRTSNPITIYVSAVYCVEKKIFGCP
jgi:hypothetical protein